MSEDSDEPTLPREQAEALATEMVREWKAYEQFKDRLATVVCFGENIILRVLKDKDIGSKWQSVITQAVDAEVVRRSSVMIAEYVQRLFDEHLALEQ